MAYVPCLTIIESNPWHDVSLASVNFGPWLNDPKGITQGLIFNGEFLSNYTIVTMPITAQELSSIPYRSIPGPLPVPAFYQGTFSIAGTPLVRVLTRVCVAGRCQTADCVPTAARAGCIPSSDTRLEQGVAVRQRLQRRPLQ